MSKLKQFCTAILCLFFTSYLNASVTLHELSGQNTSFADLKGKWVFINYWASWCQSCIDEIPELNHFYETNKHKNVAIFAVNFDEMSTSMQQRLVRQLDIRYPVLKKDPAEALHLGDITGVPATFVFNPQGELSKTLYGKLTVRRLKKVID